MPSQMLHIGGKPGITAFKLQSSMNEGSGFENHWLHAAYNHNNIFSYQNKSYGVFRKLNLISGWRQMKKRMTSQPI